MTHRLSRRAEAADSVAKFGRKFAAADENSWMTDSELSSCILRFAVHYMRPLAADGRSNKDQLDVVKGVYDALEELGVLGDREARS